MQTRFDQAVKQMLRTLLEPCGTFTPAMEVSPDPQIADGYFEPDPNKPSPVADTLLGRMTSLRCSLEAFSTTPSADEVSECVRKHLNMRHILSTKGLEGPLPYQWIVSAGLPEEAIRATRGRQTRHWPRGVLGLPDMLATSIIAVNKLPETPSTLPLRLMGRGRTLRRAVEELRALPEDEFQRCATLPVLIRYRITASALPALPEEEEYLVNTEEIIQFMIRKHGSRELEQIEQLKQDVLQERQHVLQERQDVLQERQDVLQERQDVLQERQQAKQEADQVRQQAQQEADRVRQQAQQEADRVRQQAQQEVDQVRQQERSFVLRLLTRRFGPVPPHIAERIQTVDMATLERYAERLVVVSTIEDVIADA